MGFSITKKFATNQVNEDDFLSEFATDLEKFDNIDNDVIEELKQQEQKDNKTKEFDFFNNSNENFEENNSIDRKQIAKFNEHTSEIIVNIFDKFMSFALSVYSLSDNIDDYKINKDDFSEIVEMVSAMLPKDKKVFPIWLQLTITASMSWTPLMLKAHRDRKETKELREQKKKNEEHELKIRELELKIKEKEVFEKAKIKEKTEKTDGNTEK